MTVLVWFIFFAVLYKASGSAGVISTLIGYCSGDGGAATSANMQGPTGVVLDSSGNIYIGSFYDYKIRKVSSTGTITSIVGTNIGLGTSGSIDASGTSASVNIVYGLALDSSKNVYIADTGNHKIRKLTVSTGIVSTYACDGTVTTPIGVNGGAATSTSCYYPFAVALDSSDNVYIADTYHNQVRKVTASTGIITAFAGSGSTSSLGDGGAATSAGLYYPKGIAIDSSGIAYSKLNFVVTSYLSHRYCTIGNGYIGDSVYSLVRKVTASTGKISTIAGTLFSYSFSGDSGPATSATLNIPNGVTLDPSGINR